MLNMLYKELNLSTHKFFLFFPLITGALFLIPEWPFFIALMYFFFVTVPNQYGTYNALGDNEFSVMMPVTKREIVGARIMSFMILELIHIVTGAFFAGVNIRLYPAGNFLLDLNFAFFGLAFVMFSLFNWVFFPLYYRTAYRYGLPVIAGTIVTILFAAAVELPPLFLPGLRSLLEGTGGAERAVQLVIFFSGALIFGLSWFPLHRISTGLFEKVDI